MSEICIAGKTDVIEKWLDIIKTFDSHSGSSNYKARAIMQKGINKVFDNTSKPLNAYYDISPVNENSNLKIEQYALVNSFEGRFCLLAKSLCLYTQKQEHIINYVK